MTSNIISYQNIKNYTKSHLVDFTDFPNNSIEIFSFLVKYKVNCGFVFKNNKYEIYTLDGSEFILSKKKFIDFKEKYSKDSWFRTELINEDSLYLSKKDKMIIENYPNTYRKPFYFGTFAIRKDIGFITTLRGKSETDKDEYAWVKKVDFQTNTVYANKKATLNASFLAKIFHENPHINYIIHDHDKIGQVNYNHYTFPGTIRELRNSKKENGDFLWYEREHGYIAGFSDFEDCLKFCLVKSKNFDWNLYGSLFPERYIARNEFDDFLSETLSKVSDKKVLEVGAGTNSYLLEEFFKKHKFYLLDPYVKKNKLYIDKIDYSNEMKFDYIIFRGSINYLSKLELSLIKKFMHSGTSILFNTFKEPPKGKIKRNFVAQDVSGYEQSSFTNDLIKHRLVYSDKNLVHYFYYYTLNDFEKSLGFPLSIKQVRSNSLILEGKL